jgi:hypothetical protein
VNSAKRFVIVNGSPRTEGEATSALLSRLAEEKLALQGAAVQRIDARKSLKGETQADFTAMAAADALVFIFPLYFFCTPGLLMRFLQDYAAYHSEHGGGEAQRVYAIVNCGFPEPEINTEALRVIASFSRHIGAAFQFGVCIGGGGMLQGATDATFMKTLFAGLDEAITRMARGQEGENVMLAPCVPRIMYFLGGNFGWRHLARKNGLKKKDLYAKPYAQ